MKQSITKKQWDEVVEDKQLYLAQEMGLIVDFAQKPIYAIPLPNIGRMIEFLGDDFPQLLREAMLDEILHDESLNDKLCDILWKAVKEKLNEK